MSWNYDYSADELIDMLHNGEDITDVFDGDIADLF